jgi:hypothetical protein
MGWTGLYDLNGFKTPKEYLDISTTLKPRPAPAVF